MAGYSQDVNPVSGKTGIEEMQEFIDKTGFQPLTAVSHKEFIYEQIEYLLNREVNQNG